MSGSDQVDPPFEPVYGVPFTVTRIVAPESLTEPVNIGFVSFVVRESTVTVGLVVSYVTWLSVDVEAALVFPAGSWAAAMMTSAMTVPSEVMPATEIS